MHLVWHISRVIACTAACVCVQQPTASLRKLVEDVVLQSDYNAVVAERVAGLLADMVEKGHFDE